MKTKHSDRYKQLGLKISYYRKMRGLSQLELAEKVGISRTHMSNIEAVNMPTSISLDTLFDIADVLAIPVEYLVDFNPRFLENESVEQDRD